MDGVRPKVRGRLLVAVVGSAVAMLVVAGGSFAAAGAQASGPPTIQGEEGKLAGRRQPARPQGAVGAAARPRQGRVRGPVQQVRSARGVSDPGAFLATGLPYDDVAAARAYLSANRELLGLSEEALAEPRGAQRPGARRGQRRALPPALRRPAGRTRRPRDRGRRRGQGRVPVVVADDRDRADRLRHHLARGRGSRRGRGGRACSRRDLESPCGEQLDADGRRGLQRPGPRAARRGADADRRRPAGVRGPADGRRRRRSDGCDELRGRGERRAARARRDHAVRRRQPGVEGVRGLAAARLLVDGHAAALVLEHRRAAGGCQKALANASSPAGWDTDAALGTPWFLTRGNNARVDREVELERGQRPGRQLLGVGHAATTSTRGRTSGTRRAATRPRSRRRSGTTSTRRTRTCTRCTTACTTGRTSSASPRRRSTRRRSTSGAAALQNDPEHGNAQAGGIVGGAPGYASRDNANQFSPNDGVVPMTNMYLWQPIPSTFYAAVRRRRLRHVRDRRTSTATWSRTAWSPGRTPASPATRPGAMGESWSNLAGGRVPQRPGPRPGREREPVRRRRRTPPATRWRASATTR